MRGASAIVGLGSTGVGVYADQTPISLASQAVAAALANAGLRRQDIDGLIVHIGAPRGSDYDETASQLGLSVRFASQTWSHGRFGGTVIQHAAMAVSCGLADYVLCLGAYRNTKWGLIGSRNSLGYEEYLRAGNGPHGEVPSAGFIGPVAAAGFAARRYFEVYGHDWDKLATIPLTFRSHAMLNPNARIQKKMTRQDYVEAPFIVEPLRLNDCSAVVDGAVAIIVTSAERARDCADTPIHVLGIQGISAGPDEFIFGQPGLGVNQASRFDYRARPPVNRAYEMAGIVPKDVDTLQVYDAFSPLVLYTLERMGFCGIGEAADFVQDGRIEIGGELPTNTSGGMLSEGHLNGWSQIAELVLQLRGEAGSRQVKGARIGQWSTALGDALILGRDAGGRMAA